VPDGATTSVPPEAGGVMPDIAWSIDEPDTGMAGLL